MFKGIREKFGRLTDSQQAAVVSLIWVSILEDEQENVENLEE